MYPMVRIQLTELTAFVAVAEHRSFTKAAAQVGIALPTMSQTIQSFEHRIGVRLFNRTTRSVALTEAGDRLLAEVQPILDGVDHALENVNSFRDKPIGTLRLAVDRTTSGRSSCRFLPNTPIFALKSLSRTRTATLSAAGSMPGFVAVKRSSAT
jgi:DNA-binding transcriptional LysR family regulator